jgi:hypothetical protein
MKKRESTEERKQRLREVTRRLKRAYPDATTALKHTNAFELLVATILSEQSSGIREHGRGHGHLSKGRIRIVHRRLSRG